jgi:hypothetical protein
MKRFSLLLISFLTMSLLIIAQVKMFVHQKDGTLMSFLTYRVDSVGFVYSEVSDTPVVSGTKLYFINTPSWENVYVHIWSGATYAQYSAWPGVLANKEDIFIEGFDVYSFDMKGKEKYDKIIFNNGYGGEGNQTSDLNIDYQTPYYMRDNWHKSLDERPYHNDHEYVNLGLPSGVLWATCNVGADSPEEYGDYFAWGETEPKDNYDWDSYKWMTGGMFSKEGVNKYTIADYHISEVWYDSNGKFIGDNKTILELSDDAANVNWGGDWRMPTIEDRDELRTECTWTWTTKNGVNGYTVTGPNGNSIFLPAAGYRFGSYLYEAGSDGIYWSSSLYSDYSGCAYSLVFNSDFVDYYSRCEGYPVRPVIH